MQTVHELHPSTRAPTEHSFHLSYLGISSPCTRLQPAAPHLSTCGISTSPGSPCSILTTQTRITIPASKITTSKKVKSNPVELKRPDPVAASRWRTVRCERYFWIPRQRCSAWAELKQEQNSPDLLGCLKGSPELSLSTAFFLTSFSFPVVPPCCWLKSSPCNRLHVNSNLVTSTWKTSGHMIFILL